MPERLSASQEHAQLLPAFENLRHFSMQLDGPELGVEPHEVLARDDVVNAIHAAHGHITRMHPQLTVENGASISFIDAQFITRKFLKEALPYKQGVVRRYRALRHLYESAVYAEAQTK